VDAAEDGERFAPAATQSTIAANTKSNVVIRMVVDGKTGIVIRKEF
jgi:hypothetical protein